MDVIEDIEALPTVDYAYARSNFPIVEFFLNERWQEENFTTVSVRKIIDIGKIKAYKWGD